MHLEELVHLQSIKEFQIQSLKQAQGVVASSRGKGIKTFSFMHVHFTLHLNLFNSLRKLKIPDIYFKQKIHQNHYIVFKSSTFVIDNELQTHTKEFPHPLLQFKHQKVL